MLDRVSQTTLETIRNAPGVMVDLNSVINTTANKLGGVTDRGIRFAVTTFLNDLLRNGILAFGNNDGGWETQAVFLTERGRKTMEHASRDPINSNGYLKYLDEQLTLDAATRSYVEEALNTYKACCYKATAVLIGAAVELLVLKLRDAVRDGLTKRGVAIPQGLDAWQVKTALEACSKQVLPDLASDAKRTGDESLRKLREDADARLLPIAAEFRRLRNSAGHPATLDPVEATDVHANLLLFPSSAKLLWQLTQWATAYYV